MNYYNPYFSMMPYNYLPNAAMGAAGKGLLGGITSRFNLGSIISGTQKTLGIINQAIPVIKQVGPVVKNAKTMFSVMNEFKKVDTPTTQNKQTNKDTQQNSNNNQNNIVEKETTETPIQTGNGPTFFL